MSEKSYLYYVYDKGFLLTESFLFLNRDNSDKFYYSTTEIFVKVFFKVLIKLVTIATLVSIQLHEIPVENEPSSIKPCRNLFGLV